MDRHISMGPGFVYDYSKSEEENHVLEREYYKRFGVDIDAITPEEEERILKEFGYNKNDIDA